MTPDFSRLTHGADFYFVRHGESEANRAHIVQGRQNTSLTRRGREQAAVTGGWFGGRGIDLVFASPLDRAFETATIIADRASLPAPVVDERLVELDTGMFSGLSFEEIPERYPAEWERFQSQSWEAVRDAESAESLRTRAFSFWDNLIDQTCNGHRAVLSVSHGGTIQWLIKATLAMDTWMPLFAASNCGIFHFIVRPVKGDGEGYHTEWRLLNHRAGV